MISSGTSPIAIQAVSVSGHIDVDQGRFPGRLQRLGMGFGPWMRGASELLQQEQLIQNGRGISCLQSVDEWIPCRPCMTRMVAMTALQCGAYFLAGAHFFLFSYSAFAAG